MAQENFKQSLNNGKALGTSVNPAYVVTSSGSATQPVSGSVAVTSLPTLSSVTTLSTVTTANVVSKNLPAVTSIAQIAVATPFTSPIIDAGSTMLYTKLRVRVTSNQPITLEVRNGTSTTVTSNQVSLTQAIPANTPTIVDVPLVARYASIKLTNTGAATTTLMECHQMLLGQ